MGLSKGEQMSLHQAWIKLRDRRHRITTVAVEESDVFSEVKN
jgi:hypothetical protein